MARQKHWSGRFIVVWDDGSWEFFRCCRCGKLLEERESRARGLGPECVKHAPIDLVAAAKLQDRQLYRHDMRSRRYIEARRRPRGAA